MFLTTRITVVILELILAFRPDLRRAALIRFHTITLRSFRWIIIISRISVLWRDASFKFLPYQLSMVVYWTTMALTGNGELGFDSGEGAWETATTSKEGSRRANYPILTQGGSDKKYQHLAYLMWVDWNEYNLKYLTNSIGGQVWCQQPR